MSETIPAPAPAEEAHGAPAEAPPVEAPPTPAPPPPVAVHTVEDWALLKATPARWFAVAKVREAWAIGTELTEAQYDAALHAARHEVCR
jgi:hypothetical protein